MMNEFTIYEVRFTIELDSGQWTREKVVNAGI